MRLIQTGSPVVGLSTNISTPEEPSGFVAVDVPVRIEPPPKYLPQLTLACSLGSEDSAHRVLEESKRVYNWLRFAIVAYALSPIDLIPDFIPVLGYVDDLVLLPLGIYLLIRLIPDDVLEECRERAAREGWSLGGKSRIAAAIILVIWAVVIALIAITILRGVGIM